MARLPRLTVPGIPHHVIQRGNNRQAIVVDDRDRETLLDLLIEHAAANKVAVHAWVLMDNHFHLLATPSTETGLPKLMQAVGRRYVQLFNKRHGRTGTLWEGRYRSTLVQTDRYLLACMAYLDLNPVRAGMVQRAADWRWSSHRHYIGQAQDRLVTQHPLAWSLGNTPFAREAAYADWVQQGLARDQQLALTESVLKGWALGDREFLDALAERTQRRTTRGRAGRPPARSRSPDPR